MASSGVGKTRMTRDATLKASHKWRLLILSSGEQPFESKLVEDTRHGKRAFAGQLVRAIDIQANRGAAGVFDHYPDFDSKAFTDEMKRAASRFHGTAGPEFVRRLIEHGIGGDIVRAKVGAFVGIALANEKDYHGQAGRTARSGTFSRLMAAPASRTSTGRRRTLLLPSDQRIPNRAGYRRGKAAKQRWLILPQEWREEVCQGFNPTEVAKILHGFGMLEPGENGELARKQRPPNGQGTQRFYVLTPSIFEGWKNEKLLFHRPGTAERTLPSGSARFRVFRLKNRAPQKICPQLFPLTRFLVM